MPTQGATTRIPTGLAVAIPPGFEGQIRARSSLGAKGMILPNGVGTIDADYRGEIQILATWIGENESFKVEAGRENCSTRHCSYSISRVHRS